TEWTPDHGADPELFTSRYHFVLCFACLRRVVNLVRDRRDETRRPANHRRLCELPAAIVRDAPVADLAGLHEAGHGLHRLLDRRDAIPLVDEVEIEPIGL